MNLFAGFFEFRFFALMVLLLLTVASGVLPFYSHLHWFGLFYHCLFDAIGFCWICAYWVFTTIDVIKFKPGKLPVGFKPGSHGDPHMPMPMDILHCLFISGGISIWGLFGTADRQFLYYGLGVNLAQLVIIGTLMVMGRIARWNDQMAVETFTIFYNTQDKSVRIGALKVEHFVELLSSHKPLGQIVVIIVGSPSAPEGIPV